MLALWLEYPNPTVAPSFVGLSPAVDNLHLINLRNVTSCSNSQLQTQQKQAFGHVDKKSQLFRILECWLAIIRMPPEDHLESRLENEIVLTSMSKHSCRKTLASAFAFRLRSLLDPHTAAKISDNTTHPPTFNTWTRRPSVCCISDITPQAAEMLV